MKLKQSVISCNQFWMKKVNSCFVLNFKNSSLLQNLGQPIFNFFEIVFIPLHVVVELFRVPGHVNVTDVT